jgi:hypothetical protein
VFGIIYFWSETDTPAWADELNPITREPYTSLQEYEDMHRLSQQEINRQREQITNSQSQPPPASTPAPTPAPQPQPPPAPALDIKAQREQEKKAQRCTKIAGEIYDLIYTVREKTTGPRPAGYQGLAKRWWEYATNEGKWGPQPDGSPGKNQINHLAEYKIHQRRLVIKLDEWRDKDCEEKNLPPNARQYAAQEPQLGPGKPLVPAPTPIYSPAVSPAVSVPQAKKPSK